MELFLYQIINHVKENMTSISLVDENYGQLDNIDDSEADMYPITFPAVLIDLQEATWTNLAHSAQKGTVKVNVQLIIDCYDDTHAYSGTMEAIKQRAQLVESLHALLQGYRPKDDGALIRESSKFYTANHGIKVYEMVYSVVTTSVINSRETVATPPHIALATGRL